MLYMEIIIYLAITFLLLGLRFGIASLLTCLAIFLIITLISKSSAPDVAEEFTGQAVKYLTFYVYGMWSIGAIWRLVTFKRDWAHFKVRHNERKKLNDLLKQVRASGTTDKN